MKLLSEVLDRLQNYDMSEHHVGGYVPAGGTRVATRLTFLGFYFIRAF